MGVLVLKNGMSLLDFGHIIIYNIKYIYKYIYIYTTTKLQ
jgi:hypothetical protein